MDKLQKIAEISEKIGTSSEAEYQESIHQGKNLTLQKAQIENQLKEIEIACIADYMKESENITDLFNRVNGCDTILERLESILCKFQADLGNICQEIISLHEQTVSLNQQLNEKQSLKSKLSSFIEEMTIPQSVTHHVMYTPAHDQNFCDHLQILHQKILFFKEQDFRDALACNDINQMIYGLKSKAIFKVREFILRKTGECRKYFDEMKFSTQNTQTPQKALLKNKFFYQFLLAHERDRAKEVQSEYIETLSKVYFSYFKEYLHRLSKMEYDDKPDEYDLMAADDHNRSRSNIFSSRSTSLKNRSTVFTMGTRSSVIKEDLLASPLTPSANQDIKYTTEAIFRTVHFCLLENACREYNFLKEFFITSGERQTCELFNSIFSRTLTLVFGSFNEQYRSSFDSIAIFLSLHVVYRYREMAKNRKVNALNNYWKSMIELLYPRFERSVQMNIKSVKDCDSEKISNVDTMPHPVIRRYAEFASAISSVNDTFPDDKVNMLLMDLQNEVKNFILRTASIFTQPKEQQIFMINNYDHILNLFKKFNKNEDSKDIEEIRMQLEKRIHEIVEELLYPHFGSVICFVKDCEVYIEREDSDSLKRSELKAGPLVDSFNDSWQHALGLISRDIMSRFSNFENGNKIQQATIAQLLQYHMRFHKVLNHPVMKDSQVKSKLVNLQELMVFVKKFRANF